MYKVNVFLKKITDAHPNHPPPKIWLINYYICNLWQHRLSKYCFIQNLLTEIS